jgi:16S rRNA (adenine1518-N6/adenine1519-N6)-dimethyltransferase
VVVQLACDVTLLRTVDPAVFKPRPRVESAILALRRTGPGADPSTRELVRAAFAHRRKSLARSLEHLRPGSLVAARKALAELGLPEDARAEMLAPEQFAALAAKLPPVPDA